MARQLFTDYADTFEFGKYTGKRLDEVMAKDSRYIDWAQKEGIIEIQNKEVEAVQKECLDSSKEDVFNHPDAW